MQLNYEQINILLLFICIRKQIICIMHTYLSSLNCSHVHHIVHVHSVCHHGYFNCSYLPCPAVCTVYSDRHYHTFDGLEYDYHSDCQVYLLKVSRPHYGSL